MNYKQIVKNDITIFVLFLLTFYGIFRYSGTFDKGYFITEDHALITTNQSLETRSFPNVFDQMMTDELTTFKRFRPAWVLYLLTIVQIFGVNLLLMNLFTAFLCICTSFLLYKFCLNIGFNYFQSILFALLTLIGPATIMYIRPPDAEIVGMLMLSISLFFLSKSIYSLKKTFFYKFSFVFFLTLTALCKESFLIIIPAVLLLYIIFYSSKNNIGLIDSLKKNYIIIIIIAVFSGAILFSLLKLVGISGHSYAGVRTSLLSEKTLVDFLIEIINSNLFLISLFGVFIVFDNELQNNRLKSIYSKKNYCNLLLILCFLFLVTIPQYILYYRIGFIGRYYLPYMIGFSFLLIFLLKIIQDSKSISYFVKILFTSLVIINLFFELKTVTIPVLTAFANRCKDTKNVVESIIKSPNKDLLYVIDPIENNYDVYSLDLYFDYLKSAKEYKYDLIKVDKLSKLFSDTAFYNKRALISKKFIDKNQSRILDSSKSYSNINNILIFGDLTQKFIQKNKNWFDENNYNKKQFGNYTYYYKN